MAAKLRKCKTDEEILKCVATLYSAESFLYKLVNTTLRNHDMTKIDTLGPFCSLLDSYLFRHMDKNGQTVYRGVSLSEEMIEEYKQAVGKQIVWPAFTSTTKDRRVAEKFGNTLFVFNLKYSLHRKNEISLISHYPLEQEVLLESQSVFTVDKIEYDRSKSKHIIYMKS